MPLIAKLAMETACRNSLTFLKTSYCTQPFKLANITEDKTQNCLQLIIMSSSPGVLDGDSYELDLVIGAGCRVEVETQAYQRLFQMKDGASQKWQFVWPGAVRFVTSRTRWYRTARLSSGLKAIFTWRMTAPCFGAKF
jgi:urease accessory protein UreH